jgi:hypothetical protein
MVGGSFLVPGVDQHAAPKSHPVAQSQMVQATIHPMQTAHG